MESFEIKEGKVALGGSWITPGSTFMIGDEKYHFIGIDDGRVRIIPEKDWESYFQTGIMAGEAMPVTEYDIDGFVDKFGKESAMTPDDLAKAGQSHYSGSDSSGGGENNNRHPKGNSELPTTPQPTDTPAPTSTPANQTPTPQGGPGEVKDGVSGGGKDGTSAGGTGTPTGEANRGYPSSTEGGGPAFTKEGVEAGRKRAGITTPETPANQSPTPQGGSGEVKEGTSGGGTGTPTGEANRGYPSSTEGGGPAYTKEGVEAGRKRAGITTPETPANQSPTPQGGSGEVKEGTSGGGTGTPTGEANRGYPSSTEGGGPAYTKEGVEAGRKRAGITTPETPSNQTPTPQGGSGEVKEGTSGGETGTPTGEANRGYPSSTEGGGPAYTKEGVEAGRKRAGITTPETPSNQTPTPQGGSGEVKEGTSGGGTGTPTGEANRGYPSSTEGGGPAYTKEGVEAGRKRAGITTPETPSNQTPEEAKEANRKEELPADKSSTTTTLPNGNEMTRSADGQVTTLTGTDGEGRQFERKIDRNSGIDSITYKNENGSTRTEATNAAGDKVVQTTNADGTIKQEVTRQDGSSTTIATTSTGTIRKETATDGSSTTTLQNGNVMTKSADGQVTTLTGTDGEGRQFERKIDRNSGIDSITYKNENGSTRTEATNAAGDKVVQTTNADGTIKQEVTRQDGSSTTIATTSTGTIRKETATDGSSTTTLQNGNVMTKSADGQVTTLTGTDGEGRQFERKIDRNSGIDSITYKNENGSTRTEATNAAGDKVVQTTNADGTIKQEVTRQDGSSTTIATTSTGTIRKETATDGSSTTTLQNGNVMTKSADGQVTTLTGTDGEGRQFERKIDRNSGIDSITYKNENGSTRTEATNAAGDKVVQTTNADGTIKQEVTRQDGSSTTIATTSTGTIRKETATDGSSTTTLQNGNVMTKSADGQVTTLTGTDGEGRQFERKIDRNSGIDSITYKNENGSTRTEATNAAGDKVVQTTNADGTIKQEVTRQDGSSTTIATTSTGTIRKETATDGSSTTTLQNGNVMTKSADGQVTTLTGTDSEGRQFERKIDRNSGIDSITYKNENGSTRTEATNAAGDKVVQTTNADGTIKQEVTRQDGSSTTIATTSTGTIRKETATNGSSTTTLQNGNVMTKSADGQVTTLTGTDGEGRQFERKIDRNSGIDSITYKNENGSTRTEATNAAGDKVVQTTNADGTIKQEVTRQDGSSTTIATTSTGTIRKETAIDGSSTTTLQNGNVMTKSADGQVTTLKGKDGEGRNFERIINRATGEDTIRYFDDNGKQVDDKGNRVIEIPNSKDGSSGELGDESVAAGTTNGNNTSGSTQYDLKEYSAALQAKVDERRAKGDNTPVADIEKELQEELRSGKTPAEITASATATTTAATNAEREQAISEYLRTHPGTTSEQAGQIVDGNLFNSDMSYKDQLDRYSRMNEDGSVQVTYLEDGKIVKGDGTYFENYEKGLNEEERKNYEAARAALGKDKKKYTNAKDSLLSPSTKLWSDVLNGKNKKSQAEFEKNLGIIEQNIADISAQSDYWKGIAKNSGLDIALENVQAELNQLKEDNLTLKDVAQKADRLKAVSAKIVELNDKKNDLQDKMRDLEAQLAALPPRPQPHYETYKDSNGDEHTYGPTNQAEITAWDNKKKALDAAVAENKAAQDAVDAEAAPLQDEEKALSDTCNKYSNLIKLALATPSKGSSPGGGNPGGGGGGDNPAQKTEPQTNPPLPDNTEEQIAVYEQLSAEQLDLIAKAIQEFAKTNDLTVDRLLTDIGYSESLIALLSHIEGLPPDFLKLVSEGDYAKTQALLSSIFNGERSNIVGLNECAVSTLQTYLNDVATSNNLTLDQLINDEGNSELLKTSLSGYGDVSSQFKSLTGEAAREQVMAVNDGNGIESLSEGQVSIVRDYTATIAARRNMDVESYYGSDMLATDFTDLSKSSTFIDNLRYYSGEQLSKTLTTLLTQNS